VIDLESAAIVELAHPEVESRDLQQWLGERAGIPRVASALVEVEVEVEVPRASGATPLRSQSNVPVVLGTIAGFEIDLAVRTQPPLTASRCSARWTPSTWPQGWCLRQKQASRSMPW
jgi:hypothetical protein